MKRMNTSRKSTKEGRRSVREGRKEGRQKKKKKWLKQESDDERKENGRMEDRQADIMARIQVGRTERRREAISEGKKGRQKEKKAFL